jgi:outer membrane cobalamin receptor
VQQLCPRARPHVLAAVLTFTSAGAAAQTPPTFSLSVTEPYEVVESVGTTRRITRADIEAQNARTLDDALRLLPGVHVRTGGDGTPRIDLRGFRSRHVLLLVDGVLVNSTADSQFDPARVSTHAIREIKVSYGGSSVLYGDNALAGVIEITTVDDKADASLEVSGGTPGRKGLGGRIARSIDKWSFAAAATGYDTIGFRLPDSFQGTPLEDGARRLNSDRARGDVRAAVGYRASPAVSIASEWFFGSGSFGVPPGIIDDANDIFAQTPRFERVEDYRTASGQVSVTVAPNHRFNLRGWAFRNAQREDRARYDSATFSSMDDPLIQGTFQSRERTIVTGGSALARVDIGRLGRLRLAVNQRRESFESDGTIRDVRNSSSGGGSGGGGGGGRGGSSQPSTFGVRAFTIDQHVDVYSMGGEWQARPAPRVGVVLGAAVNAQQRPGGLTDTAPTWLAGVSYDAATAIRLRASATRKIRVPSIDQLFNTSSGNAALGAEHAYSVDAGADYRLDPASEVTVSVFTTHAHDFIERDSGEPFANQDEYRFRGAEITVRTSRIPRLVLSGSYSFLDADERTAAGTRPLQTRPRHRGSAVWSWKAIAGSIVRGAAYHAGAQLYESRGADPVLMDAAPFTLVDLGFTQTVARRFDIAFDVTNLFDRLYDQAYGLPREGRAAMLTLRARLN